MKNTFIMFIMILILSSFELSENTDDIEVQMLINRQHLSNNEMIHVKDLENGFYIVRMISSHLNLDKTQKIIVKK